MVKRERILYEMVGKEGIIAQALKLQSEGKEVDVDRCYRIGAGSYILTWDEEEEVEIQSEIPIQAEIIPELKPQVEVIPDFEPEVTKEDYTPSKPKVDVDWDFIKGLKDIDEKEAKVQLIEYAGTLGFSADKFDKRKSLEKLRKTFGGLISQVK